MQARWRLYRKLHTRAHAQGYIAAIVSAQLEGGCDLMLLREDDAEYTERQGKELAARDRERLYRQGEKARKARVAQARGISFLYPRRGDGHSARAIARARTFQSRKLNSSGRPDQKKHAERSRQWKNDVRQQSGGSGLPRVRKRRSISAVAAREQKVAKLLVESHACYAFSAA